MALHGERMPDFTQTICIVEDDESVRRALRRLIRSVGFDVEAFATAEEFLDAFAHAAKLPDSRPELTGLEWLGIAATIT